MADGRVEVGLYPVDQVVAVDVGPPPQIFNTFNTFNTFGIFCSRHIP